MKKKEVENMENIGRMLDKMVDKGLINSAVNLFLRDFLIRMNMGLERDIKEPDIDLAVEQMANTKFGSGLGLNTDFLTGEFKRLASNLIAEGAVIGSGSGDILSLDLGKIFFIFCQIHDAVKTKN